MCAELPASCCRPIASTWCSFATRASPNGATENFSDVLLQFVKVLAVDQLANERQEQPMVAKAVTLEVTTEQAH